MAARSSCGQRTCRLAAGPPRERASERPAGASMGPAVARSRALQGGRSRERGVANRACVARGPRRAQPPAARVKAPSHAVEAACHCVGAGMAGDTSCKMQVPPTQNRQSASPPALTLHAAPAIPCCTPPEDAAGCCRLERAWALQACKHADPVCGRRCSCGAAGCGPFLLLLLHFDFGLLVCRASTARNTHRVHARVLRSTRLLQSREDGQASMPAAPTQPAVATLVASAGCIRRGAAGRRLACLGPQCSDKNDA